MKFLSYIMMLLRSVDIGGKVGYNGSMIIRYDYKPDPTNANPQLLYFIFDECKYEYDAEKSFTHNIAELCFVLNGKGHLHVEKEDFAIKENDIYLINPYTRHGEYVEKRQGFYYYILGICNFSIPHDIHAEKPRNLPKNHDVSVILDMLFREQSTKDVHHEESFRKLFDLLLIGIQRLYETKIGYADHLQDNVAARIKNYIDANYLGDCSSKTIADFFGGKLNTLEIRFKKQYGISMQQYILRLRIEMAKKHLQSNNISVTDLAINCGFYNSSYFTQYFKKIVGVTPTEYKKRIQRERANRPPFFPI